MLTVTIYGFLFYITLFRLNFAFYQCFGRRVNDFQSAFPQTMHRNIWKWLSHSDNLAILFKQILFPQFPTEKLLYPFVDHSGHIAELQLPPSGPPTTRRVCLCQQSSLASLSPPGCWREGFVSAQVNTDLAAVLFLMENNLINYPQTHLAVNTLSNIITIRW